MYSMNENDNDFSDDTDDPHYQVVTVNEPLLDIGCATMDPIVSLQEACGNRQLAPKPMITIPIGNLTGIFPSTRDAHELGGAGESEFTVDSINRRSSNRLAIRQSQSQRFVLWLLKTWFSLKLVFLSSSESQHLFETEYDAESTEKQQLKLAEQEKKKLKTKLRKAKVAEAANKSSDERFDFWFSQPWFFFSRLLFSATQERNQHRVFGAAVTAAVGAAVVKAARRALNLHRVVRPARSNYLSNGNKIIMK